MGLSQQLEKQGNWLFRFRGQLPLVLFLLAIPVMLISGVPAGNEISWTVAAVIFSIAGSVIRAYTIGTTPRGTSGRNTKQQVAETLNTSGIYSVVRHPLYLGNYLMWIGIVIFTRDVNFILVVSLLYWIYYERIMMAEEAFLRNKFGAAFEKWSAGVPAFLPAMSGFKSPSTSFSFISVLRREYSGWLATIIGFAYVGFLRLLALSGMEPGIAAANWWTEWQWIIICSLAVTLVLRSLKHYTALLKEDGRS